MKFKNETDEGKMVYVDPKTCMWKSVDPGEIADLPESTGKKHGLTPVIESEEVRQDKPKSVTGAVKGSKVDTKKIGATAETR